MEGWKRKPGVGSGFIGKPRPVAAGPFRRSQVDTRCPRVWGRIEARGMDGERGWRLVQPSKPRGLERVCVSSKLKTAFGWEMFSYFTECLTPGKSYKRRINP